MLPQTLRVVRDGECVDHQRDERGRAIEQHVVVRGAAARQRVRQRQAQAGLGGAAALQRGQRRLRGDEGEVLDLGGPRQAHINLLVLFSAGLPARRVVRLLQRVFTLCPWPWRRLSLH